MRMRDELGAFYTDEAFAECFSTQGQPALAKTRQSAFVRLMQQPALL